MSTDKSATLPLGQAAYYSIAIKALLSGLLKAFNTNKTSWIGLGLFALVCILALAAPWIAPHDPLDQNILKRLRGPSAEFLMGTDAYGRDILSRILYGARISLMIGLVSITVALIIGTAIGLIAGYFGARVDIIVMQIMDVLLAFPSLILGLIIVAMMGPSVTNLIIAIALTAIPPFARIARAPTIVVKEREFIEAGRALGFSHLRLMSGHILPNILPEVLVMGSLWLATAIRVEASLAFIGLGVSPPTATWGGMIREGFENILDNFWLAFFPSIAILLVVFALNLLGDGCETLLIPDFEVKSDMPSLALDSNSASSMSVSDTGSEVPTLAVSSLTTSFRVDGQWVPVVRDLSFHIHPRETVAVVGESGSGKSVTALSIMRLVAEATGRIEGQIALNGVSLPELSEPAMQDVRGGDIGMIFQEPMTSLNPVLTVGYQVAEVLQRHRGMDTSAARAETLRLFDLVRIADAKNRLHEFPHTFSGGMRQRIMIAIALACQPRLLIADEPTTALDVTIQAQILELIRELQNEVGMAVMFITHDMGVVAEIADRVVVMLTGEKVEQGTVEQVFAHPEHAYTKKLLAAVPRLGALADTELPRRFMAADQTHEDVVDEPDHRGNVILEVRHLSTRFPVRGGWLGRVRGRVHAVEDVSFTLREGETLALVGESGCGKSTTGRSILQLVKPAAGDILFENTELTTASAETVREARQRMQMIFQDPYGSLNPRKSVGAAIREPMIVHGLKSRAEADKEVIRLLDTVGLLPEHALRFPHEFSGGQRQRLCIARCLAMQPRLIVADESVSALDVSIQAQVINLLLDLQRELQLAFLFISHDIAVVERVSHRIAVMYLGEIVEIGPRRAILDKPQHPYTQKLIAAAPIPDPSARKIRAGLMSDELKSPVRPLDWVANPKPLIQYADEHWVRQN